MMRQSLNPFIDRQYILTTPHNVEECHRRLLQEVQSTIRWIDMYVTHQLGSDDHPVFGKVEERRFTIRAFHLGPYLRGMASSVVANGRLVPIDDRTEIRLSLGMSRYGKIVTAPWLILGLVLWPISVLAFVLDAVHPPIGVGVVLFVVMSTWMVGIPLLGRWRSQKRAAELIGFLNDLLDAEVTTISGNH